MIPRKVNLVKNIPCQNMLPGKYSVSISMIVHILMKAMRGCSTLLVFCIGYNLFDKITAM
jgi:hypothetical protein